MNNMDEDIYVKREKNITVEGSPIPGRVATPGLKLSRTLHPRSCLYSMPEA